MRPVDTLPPLIVEKLDAVRALCEKYRVKRLTLFGSANKSRRRSLNSLRAAH